MKMKIHAQAWISLFCVHTILSSFMTNFVDISLRCEKILIGFIVLSYQ